MPRSATKHARTGLPISERIGMFWRFGLTLERRPVVVADLGKHPGIRREPRLAPALLRQTEPGEQHLAELLWRADRELVPRKLEDLALELGDSVGHSRPDLGQALAVELY